MKKVLLEPPVFVCIILVSLIIFVNFYLAPQMYENAAQESFDELSLYVKSTWEGEVVIDPNYKKPNEIRFYSNKKVYLVVKDERKYDRIIIIPQ